ncbi:DUF4123 domain-containing protein [Undibacterium sp. Ren11W]|uniref:DUF4123 domain-containing protein n=1 Tax=Undibacterium sp. Ren11W TaxID=3413045 RepID=UPI003BF35D01
MALNLSASADLLSALQAHQDRAASHLNWFALVDPAQHSALPQAMNQYGVSRCLLSYADDAPVAKVSPHLLQLADIDSAALKWFARNATSAPCATLIASALSFEELFKHLSQFLDVEFEDGDLMFLAFWDPAILAALIGQADDLSLYVRGPIFSPAQSAALLAPISAWWYYDRDGFLHEIKAQQPAAATQDHASVLPLKFDQAQTDLIVEASVPDQLLSHLQINAPSVLLEHPPATRYAYIKPQLARARTYGLVGTGDLLNYAGLAFMWGSDFDQHAQIAPLLQQVKNKTLRFDAAMAVMPDELDKAGK